MPHVAAKQVTITVEKIGNIRPSSIVLDWGSGCGHRLAEIAKNNNGIGVGVELAGKLANWANRNRNADGTVFFCESNGRNMSWIPNETIDFSFSVGSVWLLSVNCSLECRYDDGTNSICKPKDTEALRLQGALARGGVAARLALAAAAYALAAVLLLLPCASAAPREHRPLDS